MKAKLTCSNFDQIEEADRYGNNHALTGLNAIDTRVNIDSVRAEHGQHAHVHIIQYPDIDNVSQEMPQYDRNDDESCPIADIIHDQQWQRSNGRQ